MILARVAGRITSTVHHRDLAGRTLLLCVRVDPAGRRSGGYVIAVDRVGAGAGETVLVLDEGNGARQVLGVPGMPVRSVVVGIVDDLDRTPVTRPGSSPADAAARPSGRG
jgi:microcompartment protein CcmK/EutM